MYNITFTKNSWKEYLSYQNNKKITQKINKLIEQCARTPYEGLGNPEALKNELTGYWSYVYKRKIDLFIR